MNACKQEKRVRVPAGVLRGFMVVLGLVLAATPLALWVAWSTAGWLLVLALGAVALIGLLLCHWLSDDDHDAPATERPKLSDVFLAERSRMGPWTYHNRLWGHARFKAKMARLRKLLGRD